MMISCHFLDFMTTLKKERDFYKDMLCYALIHATFKFDRVQSRYVRAYFFPSFFLAFRNDHDIVFFLIL